VEHWSVRRVDGVEVVGRAAEFETVYAEVYREPPYHEGAEQVAGFRRQLPNQCQQPGFCMVVAEAAELIGFAFGHSLPPGSWWPHAGDEPAQIRGQARFAVMELVVRAPWRGRRIASALMGTLLADRTEPYGTLCTNPRAVATTIYRSWGWSPAGTIHPPQVDPMEILIKRIDSGPEREASRSVGG
jgi:GNAT superfamily N-acetyltransferase